MKLTFRQLFLLSFALLLSACTLTNRPSPVSETAPLPTAGNLPAEFFQEMAKVTAYQADVVVGSAGSESRSQLIYNAPDIFQTQNASSSGNQTFIYQGNTIYYRNSQNGGWLKLSIPKTDQAKNLGTPDLETWQTQAGMFVSQGSSPCLEDTCQSYEYRDPKGSVHNLLISDTTRLLYSASIKDPEGTILVRYTYPEITIEVPKNAVDYVIPGKPSAKDIELLQDIYGN
jgi:hypothetical protein